MTLAAGAVCGLAVVVTEQSAEALQPLDAPIAVGRLLSARKDQGVPDALMVSLVVVVGDVFVQPSEGAGVQRVAVEDEVLLVAQEAVERVE